MKDSRYAFLRTTGAVGAIAVAIAMLWAGGIRLSGQNAASATATVEPTKTPLSSTETPTVLPMRVIEINRSNYDTPDYRVGIDRWIETAQLIPGVGVAEIEVIGVDSPQFYSESGERPDSHRLIDFSIGRTTVMSITQSIAGVRPGIDGFVVWQWGGTSDSIAYNSTPSDLYTLGSVGLIVFLDYGMTGPEEYSGQYATLLSMTRASQLSAPSTTFTAAGTVVFFEYNGDQVISKLDGSPDDAGTWIPHAFDRGDFDSMVQAAVGE